MRSKIVGISIIILSLVFATLPNSGAINFKQLNNSSKVDFLFQTDPEILDIDLDINGIAYGHELLWKANTTGTNYEESIVAYTDGIAYIGSCSTHGQGHDKLFAVNTTNGEIIWSVETGPGYVGPVIDNDVVYFGTSSHGYYPDDEYMYCFDRFTGEEIWNKKIYGGIAESVQYDDDKIYFCSSDGGEKVYALNKDDGSIAWTFDTGLHDCANKPMLKDNALYAAYFESFYGELYKLDVSDGSEIWSVTLSSGPWDNSITSDSKGRIFLAIYGDSSMNAYSESDGSLLWTYTLHGPPLSFNAYHKGVVFIADTYGFVYAFNSSSGTLIWENKIGDCIDISSPTLSGGLIFVGTRDGREGAFFALNQSTGEIYWKYKIGASITAPPSIADGMMMCGTDGWYLYAFDFGMGSGEWILHRYDSYNTAFSPDGLTTWQNIEAKCTTNNSITTCVLTNSYDHVVKNITLKIDFNAYWYDNSGNLLKANSDFFEIDSFSSESSITLLFSEDPFGNIPPEKPVIEGPTNGRTDNSYRYSFFTTDHEGDDIYYFVDWGDNSSTGWIGPYSSGEEITRSNKWTEKGTYIIRCKAKDTYGDESKWSELVVTIPRYKALNNFQWSRFLDRFPILSSLFYIIKFGF